MPIAQFTYLKPGMDVYVTGVDTTTKAKKKGYITIASKICLSLYTNK